MFDFLKSKNKLPMRSKRMQHEDFLFMGAQGAILVFVLYLLTQFDLSYWVLGGFVLVFFVVPMGISTWLIDQDTKLGKELFPKLARDRLPGDFKDGVYVGKDFRRIRQFIIAETASMEIAKIHSSEDLTIKHLYYLDGYDVVIDEVENRITSVCGYRI